MSRSVSKRAPNHIIGRATSGTRLQRAVDPFHDKTVTVTTCGRICFNRQKINLSTVFAGQKVGIKQVSEDIWLVTFMDYDLGYFDHETCRLEPLANPFGPKVLDAMPQSRAAAALAKPLPSAPAIAQ
jgi:hypothetical protein